MKTILIGGSGVGIHAKRIVEELISAPIPKETIEITNPYNFETVFTPPLTRRERRALKRKIKP